MKAEAVVHITSAAAWAKASAEGLYTAPSLEQQGFIHCSGPEQVLSVADFLYAGQSGLVLLVVNPALLTAELRWEEYEPGSPHFPHLYGPLNLDAVTAVLPFEPEQDGTFRLPEHLA